MWDTFLRIHVMLRGHLICSVFEFLYKSKFGINKSWQSKRMYLKLPNSHKMDILSLILFRCSGSRLHSHYYCHMPPIEPKEFIKPTFLRKLTNISLYVLPFDEHFFKVFYYSFLKERVVIYKNIMNRNLQICTYLRQFINILGVLLTFPR